MSRTWADIRTEILGMLDVGLTASASSDIRQVVDLKLQRIRDRIYGLRPPPQLISASSVVTVPPTLEYISLTSTGSGDTPGFNLGDFWRLFTLIVEDEDWRFTTYYTWIRAKGYAGNQRYQKQFTIKGTQILLSSLPTSPETWDASIIYLSKPGDLEDADEPLTDPEFDALYTQGVATQFPNLFHGEERAAVLATLQASFGTLLRDFLSHSPTEKIDNTYKPAIRRTYSRSSVWPGYQES